MVSAGLPRVLLCSGNAHKLMELRALLDGVAQVLSPADARINADVHESAATFEGNALIKAHHGATQSGLVSLADDSGLQVDALDGLPGVRSARFAEDAGRPRGDASNNALLLERLANIPDDRRQARFVSVIAVVAAGHPDRTFRGEVSGSIGRTRRGEHGFGYDPLFILPDGRSMAMLTEAEKNAISHRGRALAAARPWIVQVLGGSSP